MNFQSILQDTKLLMNRAWTTIKFLINHPHIFVISLLVLFFLWHKGCNHNGQSTRPSEHSEDNNEPANTIQQLAIRATESATASLLNTATNRMDDALARATTSVSNSLRDRVSGPNETASRGGISGSNNSDRGKSYVSGRFGLFGGAPKNVGIDFQAIRLGDFGLNGGVGYFFDTRFLEPQASVSYNIHKVTNELTKNTSVYVGHSLRTWTAGIRIGL